MLLTAVDSTAQPSNSESSKQFDSVTASVNTVVTVNSLIKLVRNLSLCVEPQAFVLEAMIVPFEEREEEEVWVNIKRIIVRMENKFNSVTNWNSVVIKNRLKRKQSRTHA